MCLIVHKPAGIGVSEDLLRAALSLNRDGWGLMGFAPNGRLLLERHAEIDEEAVIDTVRRYEPAEFVLHLRQRTRGGVGPHNTHPIRVSTGLYLMHNGTLGIPSRVAGMSDTWHLVTDVLRPLAQRHRPLFLDNAFHALLEVGLRAENKIALLDQPSRRILLLNRAQGAELDGLWLSSTRWIDRRLLPLANAPQPQERSFAANELHFV
ncbi:MAG TPA: class II glutamine amidotransferase [Nevskiaceae bacterium]|nr:class II glutamine amidotransferase [Nevskiaceae bacterium]